MGLPEIDNLSVWITAQDAQKTRGRGASKKKKNFGLDSLRSLIRILGTSGHLVKSFSSWTSGKFGDEFVLHYGKNLPAKNRSETGEAPVYGSNGVVGSHSKGNVFDPCLVIGRKGSAGAINRCEEPSCWVTDVAYYFVPPSGFDLRYCEILFSTLKLDKLGKGIKPGLNRNEAYQIALSYPDYPEQERIVAKVDELMGLIDDLEAQTETARESHAELVDALLRTLVESEEVNALTQNWSTLSEHFDTLFTTVDSVEKLKAAILDLAVRGRLADNELCSTALEVSKFTSDVKERFEIPNNWIFCKISDLGECKTGGTPSSKNPEFFDGDIPFVGPGDISPSGVIISESKFLTADGAFHSTEAKSGDLLMVCIGGSIGKTASVPYVITFNQQINSLSPSNCTPEFAKILLNSSDLQKQVQEKATGSATPIINKTRWQNLVVPVTSYDEQRRIVEKVDELMTLCDNLLTTIRTSEALKVELAESVVHHASVS